MGVPNLTDRELGAVLAGLRLWQAWEASADESLRDIADGGGAFAPLSDDEIDALCERLNR